MTQCDRILQYMDDFGSITMMQAAYDLGVGSLSKRICDLKAMGHNIKSKTVCGKNRYGEKTHYSVYWRE